MDSLSVKLTSRNKDTCETLGKTAVSVCESVKARI